MGGDDRARCVAGTAVVESARMSSTNGAAHVAAEMREPVRPLRAAELSSQQRNALVDSLVQAVNANAKVLTEHRKAIEALRSDHFHVYAMQDTRLAEHAARLDAHAGILLRPTLWARLRWLVTGR